MSKQKSKDIEYIIQYLFKKGLNCKQIKKKLKPLLPKHVVPSLKVTF